MFEDSFFNRIELKCVHHSTKYVTYICSDSKCLENPFLCDQCINSYTHKQKHIGHQSGLRNIHSQIQTISEEIDRNRKPIQAIYQNLINDKQSQNLLRWQQDRRQHFASIHNHIKSVKHLIEEEIDSICRKFKEALTEEKKMFDMELERYQQQYRLRFQEFSNFTEPIVLMSTIYKYCANKNNVILKLLSENSETETISWYNNMKKTVRLSKKVSVEPNSYLNELKKLSTAANDLIDDLPRIRDPQYENDLNQTLSAASKQILRTFVKVREVITPNTIQRSTSLKQQSNPMRSFK